MEKSQIIKGILQLVIFDLCLPTLDVYSDLALVAKVFEHGHPRYAAVLLFPLLLNCTLTWFTWWRVASAREKCWSWVLVLAQVWPQYEAVKVMVMLARGREEALSRKKMLDRDVSSLEPFLESVPQVFIMTYFYFNLLVDKEAGLFGMRVVEGKAEEKSIVLGEDLGVFFNSYFISILAASFGLTKFLKSGPCRILPDVGTMSGICTIRFFLTFLAVLSSLVAKGCILAGLIMHAYFMDTPALTRLSMFLGTTKKDPPLALSICTTLLPQLLLSFLSLSLTLGCGRTLWRTIASYPALLLLPVFSHFTFGSRKSRCSCRCCGGCCADGSEIGICGDGGQGGSQEEIGQLVMSKRWTGLNILVSILGVAASFANVIWEIGKKRFWRADTVTTALPLIVSFSLGYVVTILVLVLDRCGELQFGVFTPHDPNTQHFIMSRDGVDQLVPNHALQKSHSVSFNHQLQLHQLHQVPLNISRHHYELSPKTSTTLQRPQEEENESQILHPLVESSPTNK